MMDKEMIEAGVELYYDSLHESSAEKVHEAFHANARITGYLHGDFMDMSVDQFADFVASQQPSPAENNDEKVWNITSCKINGATAAVMLEETYLGIKFVDTLSFLKVDNDWRIYNKLFHVVD